MATEKGFFGRRHDRIALHDLEECFIARLLLAQVVGDWEDPEVEVDIGPHILFPQLRTFSEAQGRFGEEAVVVRNRLDTVVADGLSALFGAEISAKERSISAIEYYDAFLDRRLGYLAKGDSLCLPSSMIQAYQRQERGLFRVRFSPRRLADALASGLPKRFELMEDFLRKAQSVAPNSFLRVDHRKALDMLQEYLSARVALTGEVTLAFDSSDVPFRHALLELGNTGMFMASPGTANPVDKSLLPLLLEIHGQLDVDRLFVTSDPFDVDNATVHYVVRRPAIRNGYKSTALGLNAQQRASLSESQLVVYARTFETLNRRYVLGGRPELEKAFADVLSWALRKQAYCLEEPSFLHDPALKWLADHVGDRYVQAEDNFFLPFILERLNDAFGNRVLKKPKRFGGEIDILFDSLVPIELKVRRGEATPLGTILDEKYAPTGQAAAYAALTRLGFVFVLDLPSQVPRVMNLESCVHVIERDVESNGLFPTCVVVCIFHAHSPRPSSVK